MSAKHVHFLKSLASRLTAVMVIAMMVLMAAPVQVASAGNPSVVTITSVTVGAQNGTLMYYTENKNQATFPVVVGCGGNGGAAYFWPEVTGLPTGVNGSFTPLSVYFPNNCGSVPTQTITLTVTTLATTPGGTTAFTVAIGGQSNTGDLIVSGKPINVTGTTAADKIYDGTTEAVLDTDYSTLEGAVLDDIVGLDVSGVTGAFENKGVGTDKWVFSAGFALTGANANNYSAVQPQMKADITPKPIASVTADDKTMNAGDPDPEFTFTYGVGDLVEGETPAQIDTPPTCGVAGPHSTDGIYPITCSGGSDNNYSFTGTTYNDGTLTVGGGNNPPTDIALSNASVKEHMAADTVVGNLTSTDPDPDATFTYTLETGVPDCNGADNASFHVGSLIDGTRQLQTTDTFHYLTKNAYNVCIQTKDEHGGVYAEPFVVSILPSTVTFRSNGTYDGWVLESTETSGVGGTMDSAANTLRVGDDASDRQYRVLLAFNTLGLPDNAVILKATLTIASPGGQNYTGIHTALNGLRVDIKKPAFGAQALELSDFQATVGTTGKLLVGRFGTQPVLGLYSADIGSTGLPYVNKQGYTQFRLRFYLDDNDNQVANYLLLYSGSVTTTRIRPTLIVTYSAP